MELSEWVGALHDNSNKLIIFKAYVPLLGLKATVLLMHLNTTMDNRYRVYADEDGVLWHRQSLKWMARQSSLSESALRIAKKTLVDLGFIQIRQTATYDRTTYWRVDQEKLARFCAFAHALYAATRPDNRYTLPQWQRFANAHPEIVEEFRPLYPRLDQFSGRQEMQLENSGRVNLKAHAAFATREAKQRPMPRPCRFVEFWNTLPNTPRCTLGTKAYEQARRFFAAHRRFEAGNCSEFFLTSDEQQRIRLDKINRVPPTAELRGPKKTPVRSDDQMFRHIELAARSYRVEFTPRNKALLPRGLPAFLYTSHSKKYGTCSMFLERVGIFRPQLLDDVSREGILTRATPEELETVEVLKSLYDEANRRDETQQLSLRELKAALAAARGILSKYDEIPVNEVSIFASHFGSYDWFLDWFRRFAEDQLWDGMPMTAFDVNKDLWRRFVDFVGADIGYDLFTGERI